MYEQALSKIDIIPASLHPFCLDANFASVLLIEQIQRHLTQQREVLGRMVFANAASIFVEPGD